MNFIYISRYILKREYSLFIGILFTADLSRSGVLTKNAQPPLLPLCFQRKGNIIASS